MFNENLQIRRTQSGVTVKLVGPARYAVVEDAPKAVMARATDAKGRTAPLGIHSKGNLTLAWADETFMSDAAYPVHFELRFRAPSTLITLD